MSLESKAFGFNSYFYTNLLTLRNSDSHTFSFFNDGGLKLGHFDILDMLFPFLAFVKL